MAQKYSGSTTSSAPQGGGLLHQAARLRQIGGDVLTRDHL
jgi:hypothetical protein